LDFNVLILVLAFCCTPVLDYQVDSPVAIRLGFLNVVTHWVDVVTDDMDDKEKELIRELDPTCNKKVG
jgi:hypothetical protein